MSDTQQTSTLAASSSGFARATCRTGTTLGVVTVAQTTPAAITAVAYRVTTGVVVTADPANTGTVEVGYGGFTLGDGQPLNKGDSIRMFPESAEMIFAASSASGQKIRVLVE